LRRSQPLSDGRIVYGFHAVISRLRQHATGVQEIYLTRRATMRAPRI
jgi:hypothetical protein